MENEYKRICKNCGQELVYVNYNSYYSANKRNTSCKSCASRKRSVKSSDLSILLLDTVETYYWIGFLLADGCFSNNRIHLAISNKDKEHLLKFAKYINYTGTISEKENSIGLNCMDSDIVPLICLKFDIKENKTYNPSNFIIPKSDLGFSLIAGLIDGDGCIRNQTGRKDFYLTIKMHSSWENFLIQINNLISNKNTTKINNAGYASFTVSNTEELKDLKRNVEYLNIPILTRKWDIINYTFESRLVGADLLKNQVLELLKNNVPVKEIIKITGTSKGNVYRIKRTYYENN